LVFFFDGKDRPAVKAETMKNRRKQRNRRMENMQRHCLDGEIHQQEDFPAPVLLEEQLLWSLFELGVEARFVGGEADAAIASACQSSETNFVWANDSDFLLFRDIRYITFDSLRLQTTGMLVSAVARVWTRACLASLFGLSECMVVEMAILLGSDFTSYIDHTTLSDNEGTALLTLGLPAGIKRYAHSV
jgi:5'-3' exonuclease